MKFQKLNNLDNFKDKKIAIQGEMPITMANAFEVSERRTDELNKRFKEQEKNAEEFVKEWMEGKKNYKLTLPEPNRANYKKMHLIENLSKMSKKQLVEELKKCVEAMDDEAQDEKCENGEDCSDKKCDLKEDTTSISIARLPKRALKGYSVGETVIMGADYPEEWKIADYDKTTDEFILKKRDAKLTETIEYDLWDRVYNELSPNFDPNYRHQIKTEKGEKRYEDVRTDYDGNIVVYANTEDDFGFARKVADHYGVSCSEPKKDGKRDRFYVNIKIPEDGVGEE